MITYLIVKLIGKCNLGCNYCYYMNDLANDFRTRIALETAVHMYERFSAYARAMSLPTVAFSWHGGEPTLVGKEFFQNLLEEQRRHFDPDIRVNNQIQTNGTLVDEQWAELFSIHNFSVGVSIDGSPENHDRNRYYHNKNGSYDRVVQCINLLRSYGVRFGTITVIDPSLNGSDVFDHHYRLGIRKMDFNLPIVPYANFLKQHGLTGASAFAKFMRDVLDAWLEKDDPEVEIRNLVSLMRLIIGASPIHCHSTNQCDRYLTIESNGDVGLCENLRVIDKRNSQIIPIGGLSEIYNTRMNVNKHTFFEIESAIRDKFNKYHFNKRGDICNACDVKDVCNSGCPVHRFREGEGFQNPSFFCEYYKLLIGHISQRLNREFSYCIPGSQPMVSGKTTT